MDTNKMREQFEAAFVAQYGFGRMAAASNPDANAIYCAAEWAWQASREAVVIDLSMLQHQHEEGPLYYRVDDVHAAIEDQGLKVTP